MLEFEKFNKNFASESQQLRQELLSKSIELDKVKLENNNLRQAQVQLELEIKYKQNQSYNDRDNSQNM